jgi:hypothetical protein
VNSVLEHLTQYIGGPVCHYGGSPEQNFIEWFDHLASGYGAGVTVFPCREHVFVQDTDDLGGLLSIRPNKVLHVLERQE